MKRKLLYISSFLLGSIVALVIAGYFYLQNFAQQPIHISESNQLFVLKPGTTINQLIQQMETEKLIENGAPLSLLVRLNSNLRKIKAGTYLLADNMTVQDFLLLLASGKEAQFFIQFIEGTTAKEWLEKLKNAPYIQQNLVGLSMEEIAEKLNISDKHIEGWFYPDTYSYTANTSDITILERAHRRMISTLEETWQSREIDLPYQSAYEMLIMASIIEKETGLNSERGLVSSVFVNRLRDNMKLQTDPTVIYGMGDSYNGSLSGKDTRIYSPYNTYMINALPPTPIAMPSKASIEAAAHPTKSNFFYFVADGYGGHKFSTNLKSHNLAVQEYYKIIRARNN